MDAVKASEMSPKEALAELHRTDTFDAKVPMGCLSAGVKEEREYVIATFRRLKA